MIPPISVEITGTDALTQRLAELAKAAQPAEITKRLFDVAQDARQIMWDKMEEPKHGKDYRLYPYKTVITASSKGEAPAIRTGNLRKSIFIMPEFDAGMVVIQAGGSLAPYGRKLEKELDRPFFEVSVKESWNKNVKRILAEVKK